MKMPNRTAQRRDKDVARTELNLKDVGNFRQDEV